MDPQTPVHRPWTLMVYMAGDNGKIFDTKTGRIKLMASMEEAGYRDLFEMGTVGTSDQCAVTCLFDTLDASYLVEVRKGQRFSDSLVQPLREVNMGDPNTLKELIIRSVQNYPADHYALVIWNHGTGWLDVDHYATVRALEDENRTSGAIFRTTYQKITAGETTRPIAFDDSSKDFLDTADLRQAFSQAQEATGRRLDIIGMDACLMAMIEGARELTPFADYFIGSQEVEPMDGWPYAPILQALNADPAMTPAVLADRIVREFAVSYNATNTRGRGDGDAVGHRAGGHGEDGGSRQGVGCGDPGAAGRRRPEVVGQGVPQEHAGLPGQELSRLGRLRGAAGPGDGVRVLSRGDGCGQGARRAAQPRGAPTHRCCAWPSGPGTRAPPDCPSMCRPRCSRAGSARRRWRSIAICCSRWRRGGIDWWSGSTASSKGGRAWRSEAIRLPLPSAACWTNSRAPG